MPKSQAIAFFEEISKNNKLAQEVEKVVGGKNSDEAKAKELISLAKKHNFNFTKEEAASAQGALKTSLSPEDMLEVSGGKLNLKSSLMAMTLLAGLGVGGAAMSSIETSAMEGDNHQEIQVPEGQAAGQQQEANNQGQQEGDEAEETWYDENGAPISPVRLGYNYIATIFEAPYLDDIGDMLMEVPSDVAAQVEGLLHHQIQRVRETGKYDSDFFKTYVHVSVLLHKVGVHELQDGDPADLLLQEADLCTKIAPSQAVLVTRHGLSDLANEIQPLYTRVAAGYRALAERVRTNDGVVDDETLNEIIALHYDMADFDNRLEDAVQEAEEQARSRAAERARREAEEQARREAEERALREAEIENLEIRLAQLRARRPAQQNDLGAAQRIQARENQHIEAGPSTHVHSFSDNELIHEGAGHATISGTGGVDIDVGDITVTVSECNEDLSRNVTVNQANSLTVAPGITMHTQNGTEFTMGATREETIDNLIPDIQPSAHQERGAQQRNLNFNNPRLQRMLAWAMDRFGLSGQDLIDFVQRFFIQGG